MACDQVIKECINLDVVIDLSNEELGAKEVLAVIRPQWNLDKLKIKHFSEGISNKVFGCWGNEEDNEADVVMFRIFGERSELIIDRQAEQGSFIKLSKIGCSPPLYCVFKNGLAYGYAKGRPIGVESVRKEEIYRLITKEIVKIHCLDSATNNNNPKPEAFIYQKIENFIAVLPSSFSDPQKQELFEKHIPNKKQILSELKELKSHLDALKSPVVFCHNDLLLNNIIYDDKNHKVAFIDYEYAFYNFQAFDIANHFCEFAGVDEVNYDLYPSKELQFKWLQLYLENWFEAMKQNPSEVTSEDVEKLYVQVNKCVLASHFFWGIWAVIQAYNSSIDFDFLGYSKIRFDEYFRRKPELLSLSLP